MKSICEDIRAKKVLVSDGAWGTLLVAQGMAVGECPELWCIEHADVVRGIAARYIEAGADIVMTNSFGGTVFKLDHFGLGGRVAELNEAAARLSREAAGDDVHVMASVGPTGKFVMMGDVSEEELYDAFKVQVVALERGGADACIVETMTALDEGTIAVRAAKENTSMEVVLSFTYDTKTADGYRTMMGVSPSDMAAAALDAGVDIVGTNCSLGSDDIIEVVAELRAAAPDTPLLAHPNAGRPIQHDDGTIEYPETPEMMAANVPKLIEAGAGIIGGCCGNGPEHIAAVRAAVERVLGGAS